MEPSLPEELRWAEGVRRLGRAWRIFLLALREAGAGVALIFAAGFDGAFARRLRRGAVAVGEGLWIGLQGFALIVQFLLMLPVRFIMWWVDHTGLFFTVLVIGAVGWLAYAFEAVRAPLFWLAAIVVAGGFAIVGLLNLGEWEFKRQASGAAAAAPRRDGQSLGAGDLAGYGLVALARYALMALAAGALVFAMFQAGQRPAASGIAVLVGIGAVALLLSPLVVAAFARERARRRHAEADARAFRETEAIAPRPTPPRVAPLPPPPLPSPPPPSPPRPVATGRAAAVAAPVRRSARESEPPIEAKWAARDEARQPFAIGELWADIAPLLLALAACAVIGILVLQFGPWGLLWLALSAALILSVGSAPAAPDVIPAAPDGRGEAMGRAASLVWLCVAGGIALGLGFAAAIVSAAIVFLVSAVAAVVIFFRFIIGARIARTIAFILAMFARVRSQELRAQIETRLRAIATPLVVVACIALIAIVAVNVPRVQPVSNEEPKRVVAESGAKPTSKPTPPPVITLTADGARMPLAFAFGYRDRLEAAGASSVALNELVIGGACGTATLYAVGASSAAGASRANVALAQRRAIALGQHIATQLKTCAPPRAAIVAVALAPAQGVDDRDQRAPIVVADVSAAALKGRLPASMCLVAPGGFAAPERPAPCPTWSPIASGTR